MQSRLKAMDLPTDQPSPYSSLELTQDPTPANLTQPHVELKIGDEPLKHKEWVYQAHPWISLWTRRSNTISPDHYYFSYGISEDTHRPPLQTEPDIFFTCRLQIKSGNGKDKRKIIMMCCAVAAFTVLHQRAGGRYCDGNWWRLGSSSHGCLLHPWGLLWIKKWWQTRQLREAIEDHDRLCSCGCFDVAA